MDEPGMQATAETDWHSPIFDRMAERIGNAKSADRLIFASPEQGYVYVTNQKCACSTIKLLLYQAAHDDPDYLPKMKIHQRDGNKVPRPSDIPADTFETMMKRDGFRFTFVRTPYTRVLSQYRHKTERAAANKINDP